MTTGGATWPSLLSRLLAGETLATADTDWAMDQVMTGQASAAQIAAFVVALRAKGESAAEVRGMVDAMLRHATPLTVAGPTLDIVGTGGDLTHSVNVSTMSSIVAAAAGARVVKHGNRAATSRCGSADVLEALGIPIDLSADAVQRVLDEVGITFCFAPVFHSAMRHAAGPRREIGVPTVFNILGPLANPGRPTAQLVGCADLRLAPVMAQVLAGMGVRALVVRGEDGLDEVTTTTATRVWDVRQGAVVEVVIDVADLGVARSVPEDLRGGDATFNADVARRVLHGERGASLDPVRDAVLVNTGAALAALADVEGGAPDLLAAIDSGVTRARAAIDSGAAADVLERWHRAGASAQA